MLLSHLTTALTKTKPQTEPLIRAGQYPEVILQDWYIYYIIYAYENAQMIQ